MLIIGIDIGCVECYYNKKCTRRKCVMSDVYKLPVSSYDELIKIIKVYGSGKVGVPMSLDDLVKSSGMSKTIISKNNGFLVQLGLISEGNKKAPSDICKKLANAYSMNLQEQIVIIIQKNDEKIGLLNKKQRWGLCKTIGYE